LRCYAVIGLKACDFEPGFISQLKSKDYKGWKFNWSITEKNGYHIYELFLKDDDIVQGRISVKVDGGVADVDIVETAVYSKR